VKDSESSTLPTSTLGAEITSGLLGAGVAIACVLPPIVHLVTGPLGPLIGGFVAANRVKPGARGRAIIAAIVGTGVAGVMAVAATVLVGLAGRSQLPEWFPTSGTLTAVLCGVWLYGATLAMIGTTISGTLASKEKEPEGH
jgi:protein-S-isoprenylcysteine O-methyltransferase Ste14